MKESTVLIVKRKDGSLEYYTSEPIRTIIIDESSEDRSFKFGDFKGRTVILPPSHNELENLTIDSVLEDIDEALETENPFAYLDIKRNHAQFNELPEDTKPI